MAGGLAVIICSLVFSLVGLVAIGFLGYATLSFVRTLTPYQLKKLKNMKISNTKILKNIDEKLDGDIEMIIQDPILLELFPQAVAYATEKKAGPSLLAALLKRAAPAIPSLVAGVPAEQVAIGEAAKFGADILGSDQAMTTIQGIWKFLQMILEARKNKQIALPQNIGKTSSNAPIEMDTI